MHRTFVKLSFIVISAYAVFCTALFLCQRSLIYFPQSREINSPQSTMILSAQGAELVLTVHQHTGQKAIVYFGGNAEDVSLNLPSFEKAFPDHALYFLHYRGYGGSSGAPSEEVFHNDAITLFDKVQTDHQDITVIGRSLGSGVAVRLSSQRTPSRLVLITPFDSFQEIVADQFRYAPIKWLLLDKFDSGKYARKITIPTTIIAAENDEIIPISSTKKLFEHFGKGVASMKIIPATGHNTISNSIEYLSAIQKAL